MSIKIAIFNTSLSMGGISKALITLLNHPCMMEYEIDLFILGKENDFGNIAMPQNVKIKMISPQNKVYKCLPFGLLEKIVKDENSVREYDYAVDFNGYHNLCAVYTLMTNAKKHISWIHSDYEKRYLYNNKFKILWILMKKKYIKFSSVVCVSEGAEKAFQRFYNRNITTKVIPNIIDVKTIIEMSREKVFIEKQRAYNLISVGNLCKVKNIDKQLDILNQIKKQKDICLYIVGEGKERRHLEKKVKKMSLEEHVIFLGMQRNPYKYMRKMDGLISTSLYEGQGIVVREAQVLGLDLFIDKSLEKCNKGVKTSDNLVNDILCASRKSKKICYLDEYNNEIEKKVKELFI